MSFNFSEPDSILIILNSASCDAPKCQIQVSGASYLIQTIGLLLISTISIPANYILVDTLRTSTCVHPNVKILLINTGIGSALLSLHYFGQSIYNFSIYTDFMGRNSSDWRVHTTLTCAIFQILNSITVEVILWSMTGICVERILVLTLYRSSLSVDIDRSDIRMRIFAVFCWGIGLIFSMPNFLDGSDTCLCYCHSILVSNSAKFYISLISSLSCEISSVILCVIVRRLSIHILNDALGPNTGSAGPKLNTLTQRYQLNRNVNTMSMLYPSIMVHCLGYILALSLRVPAHSWLSFDSDASDHAGVAMHILLINMILVNVVCCVHPWLIARNNRRLAKSLIDKWPYSSKILFGLTSPQNTAGTSAPRTLNTVDTPISLDSGMKRVESAWSDKQAANKIRKSRAAVNFNKPAVTEYRTAAGAQSMVWESFWKK